MPELPNICPPRRHQLFDVRAGDFDIDRAAGGQALLEQAGLLGDEERARQLVDSRGAG